MYGKMVRSARSSFPSISKTTGAAKPKQEKEEGEEEEGLLIPRTAATSQDLLPSTLYLRPAQKFKSSLLSRSRFHPSFPSLINSTMQRKERFAPIHPPSLKNSAPCLVCICAQFALQNSACISQKDLEAFRDRGVTHPHPQKKGNGSA